MHIEVKRFNIAHRGARSLAPENTMEAFYTAWQVGAHGCETDVSVTADGKLILMHDTTLRRTTDVATVFPERVRWPVHRFQFGDLGKLDGGSWFIDSDPFGTIADGTISPARAKCFCKAAVPTLDELLQFAKQKQWFVNIEIKTLPRELKSFPVVEQVLGAVEQSGLHPELFSISSFHHPYLLRALELQKDIEVNALIGDGFGRKQDWGEYEFSIYNANVRKTDALQIDRAKKQGCSVNLYTVNDPDEMRYFLALGVEKIITDYPQVLSTIQAT